MCNAARYREDHGKPAQRLLLYALRDLQPMKADERISDVVGELRCAAFSTNWIGTRGRLGCQPAYCCSSPARSAPERGVPASGMWSLPHTHGHIAADAEHHSKQRDTVHLNMRSALQK